MKIAIVGAGLMGRLIALSLNRQAGFSVTLFDKDTKSAHNSAAYAAAGLLTPLGESLHCEANIVEMGFKSLSLWPSILTSLDDHTFFQQAGAIMVSHEQDKGDYLRFVRHLESNYPEHTLQKLNRTQLHQLEPELGRTFKQGLFLPQEGQIGNRRLLVALRMQLEQEGVNWLSECLVTKIKTNDNVTKLAYEHKPPHQKSVPQQIESDFDLVIDCRGTGANTKHASSDVAPLNDLRSVRGELFQLFAPDVHLTRPIRLMHPRYQLYIAPKGKGFYVVGATEIESDDDASMTVRSSLELLSAAYSVHPGFAEANIRQHVSQLRPAFSDNQPQIIVNKSLIQINGLFRHGFLIAPVVLEQVLSVINNKVNGTTTTSPYDNLLPVKKATKQTNIEEAIS